MKHIVIVRRLGGILPVFVNNTNRLLTALPTSHLQQSLNAEGHSDPHSSLNELIVKLEYAERHLKDIYEAYNEQSQACQLLHMASGLYEKRSGSIRSKVTHSIDEMSIMEHSRNQIERIESLSRDAILDGYKVDIEKGQKTLSQHVRALEKAEGSLAAVQMGIRLFQTIEDRATEMMVKERQSVSKAAEEVERRLKMLQNSIAMMADRYNTVVANLKIGNGLIHGGAVADERGPV